MTQYHPLHAVISPILLACSVAGLCAAVPAARAESPAPVAEARAAEGDRTQVRLSPGRVQFALTANGEWKFFGVRGEPSLLEKGGVFVYATRPDGESEERGKSFGGGMRALIAADAIAPVYEGTRGGSRLPSIQPDDDNDGQVDEDPLDLADNDGDGRVDEDFAAIGDEMVVAMYGTRGNTAVSVRQECFGWSLPHIDGMIASTITVRNTGKETIPGARIGIQLEGASGLEYELAPRIETARRGDRGVPMVETQVVLRDVTRGMAALLFTPRVAVATGAGAQAPVTEWEIRDDRSRVLAVSPGFGDLAPGQSVTVYVALISLPPDDLKSARAIHAARRTVEGDGTSRFIPPPVSLTARAVGVAGEDNAMDAPVADAGGIDPFWNQPGKLLEEKLVIGSPNPFRDQVTIEYEIPTRVVDEEGVEHTLSGAALPTSVKVYNVAGRLVATLVEAEHSPGRYRTEWTAINETGSNVASGVYYVKLQIGKRTVTMRMVQIK